MYKSDICQIKIVQVYCDNLGPVRSTVLCCQHFFKIYTEIWKPGHTNVNWNEPEKEKETM